MKSLLFINTIYKTDFLLRSGMFLAKSMDWVFLLPVMGLFLPKFEWCTVLCCVEKQIGYCAQWKTPSNSGRS